MRADLIAALVVFAFVAAATPGPNNTMLMASGVNFGFRRSMPHILGVSLGFCVMVAVVGLGVGQLLARSPSVYTALKYASGAYMLWLAWKIATSGPIGDAGGKAAPLSFLGAAGFQWINPKGWAMAVTAVTTYAVSEQLVFSALFVAAVFGLVGFPTSIAWTLFGTVLKRILTNPLRLKLFNWTMAALLVASLWPMLAE
jgi:threonine/homoserine/homoserine lactone efflux protein